MRCLWDFFFVKVREIKYLTKRFLSRIIVKNKKSEWGEQDEGVVKIKKNSRTCNVFHFPMSSES